MSVAFALRRDDGDWRVELQGGHERLSDRYGKRLSENAQTGKRFRREGKLAPE
jgi:hypothetical protein